MPRIPPKSHLNKIRKRLERLDNHDVIEIMGKQQANFPKQRVRREFLEAYALVHRDVKRLLDALLDEEDDA